MNIDDEWLVDGGCDYGLACARVSRGLCSPLAGTGNITIHWVNLINHAVQTGDTGF